MSSFSFYNYDPLVNQSSFNPKIDAQVQEIMTQNFIPSVATAVVKNNSIIWAKDFGNQSNLDKIYMVGSVTKTFTATAVFHAYDQGLLQLDDDINYYLPYSIRHPEYNNTPITIQMLLTHKSGLSKDNDPYIYGMAEDALSRIGLENPLDWLPYPHWIKEYLIPNGSLYIPEVWSPYAPGTILHYSNIGYNLLGYVLSLATGKPIWEYVQENILNPLEMYDTGYNFTEFDESKLVEPFIYQFELDPNTTGNKAYPHYNYLGYSSGAIRSTVYDLARFLLVHLHGGISNGTRILKKETTQLMHQLQASWIDGKSGLVDWSGWGGTEGDIHGFHAKAYGTYDNSTTVPYAVITLLNQGIDEARGACYDITKLLQDYVHLYDNFSYEFPLVQLIIGISFLSCIIVAALIVLKQRNFFTKKKLD